MNSRDDAGASGEVHRSEEALRAARRAKADAAKSRGDNPFANDLAGAPLSTLAEVRARCAAARLPNGKYDKDRVQGEIAPAVGEVHVVGRVMFLRSFGKTRFLRLRDRSGELQLYCHAAEGALTEEQVEQLDGLDEWDHVEAVGKVMATDKGELSVAPTRVRLITKAMRPPPGKWHGLSDIEMRYRHRYVDLVANPDVASVFRARGAIVSALRRYLDDASFLEVETPMLHPLIGGAAAKPFETHHNALDMHLFLRIAPELYLKRLLVGGLERVYEIGRCYRNEGISTRHNPEFTMLEFYEAYATYDKLMTRTEEMLRFVDQDLAKRMPEEHAKWLAARPFTLDEPFRRVPMKDAVTHALDVAGVPHDAASLVGTPDAPIKEWAQKSDRAKKKIDWANFRKGAQKCENEGELLFAAYEYLAEPFLPDDYRSQNGDKSVPVYITDYPFETSPLARRKDSNPALVDRFELFVNGRELCNAFSELNDPDDQAARFREQVEKKARGADETMDYDADYIRALEHGMPPAAGFGMGIDRLVMALTQQPSIRDVIFFPLLRAENA